MSLLDVARRVAAHQPRPFVAPVPHLADKIEVFTLQDGVPVLRNLGGVLGPGWYQIVPRGQRRAEIEREAYPLEIVDYLAELRRFFVIAVAQVDEHAWLVLPENLSVARAIGWQGEPREMYLVTENPDPLDVCIARIMGDHLLFDVLADGSGFASQKARFALAGEDHNLGQTWAAAVQILRGIAQRTQPAPPPAAPDNLADRARWHLEYVGARLVDLREINDEWDYEGGLTITWEYDGATFTADFDETLRLRNAPICLAGTDGSHNLSSVVAVMQQARHLRRFDLSEDLYL